MVDMTTPTQIAADQLAYIGVPPSLYNQVDFVESTGWPPRAGCRSSPDFSPARVWARIDLTEWLVTSPHVFGPHRTNELATLAGVGRTLRLAGEGSIVLWALDIIEPHIWVDHPTVALAVTELVCVGPTLPDPLVAATYDALTAVGWAEHPITSPNSGCVVNRTTCSQSAWYDGIATPQHQLPPGVEQAS
jgi:hypothetical protein